MKIKVKKNREQSVSRTQVWVVRRGDSCQWWMSSVWVGRTGGPVHRCPGKRHTGASNLGKQMQAGALPPQCCLRISLPDLSSIPSQAVCYFLLKNIFTLCLCCQPICFIHALMVVYQWINSAFKEDEAFNKLPFVSSRTKLHWPLSLLHSWFWNRSECRYLGTSVREIPNFLTDLLMCLVLNMWYKRCDEKSWYSALNYF